MCVERFGRDRLEGRLDGSGIPRKGSRPSDSSRKMRVREWGVELFEFREWRTVKAPRDRNTVEHCAVMAVRRRTRDVEVFVNKSK